MEVFYLATISILGLLLIYLFIRNQAVEMIDQKMKILYKEKIASDVQDIYRELENYSAIIDSRIVRLKTLTERHEAALKVWESIQRELKKSKAGKELLNYIEEQEIKPALNSEDILTLKKEITDDIKNFVAKKLNITSDTVQKPQSIKSVAPVLEKNKLPADDANIAELIIQEMDRDTVANRRKPVQNIKTEPVSFVKPQKVEQIPEVATGFLSILGAVGKALSPIFLKTGSTDLETSATRKTPEKSFNDLIRKEIKFPETLPVQTDSGCRTGKTRSPSNVSSKNNAARGAGSSPGRFKKFPAQASGIKKPDDAWISTQSNCRYIQYTFQRSGADKKLVQYPS